VNIAVYARRDTAHSSYNAYALRGVEKDPANPHSTSSIRASNSVRSTM